MTTEEHLNLILTFCRSRLALAEKRTPGIFSVTTTQNQQPGYPFAVIKFENAFSWNTVISAHVRSKEDAEFIAACAGAAEAGWCATIAAVIAILSSSQTTVHWHAILKPMRDAIRAAYPLELLTP